MALKIAPTQTIRSNAVEKAIGERLPFLASGNLVACSIVLIPSPRYSLPPLEVFRKSRARFSRYQFAKERSGVGFHSPASFCASAIWSGVICDSSLARAPVAKVASARLSFSSIVLRDPNGGLKRDAAARLSHMCAKTRFFDTPCPLAKKKPR